MHRQLTKSFYCHVKSYYERQHHKMSVLIGHSREKHGEGLKLCSDLSGLCPRSLSPSLSTLRSFRGKLLLFLQQYDLQ